MVFFCNRIEIEIVFIIYQYKSIFANHISFQLFDFLQLGNFLFSNFWHAQWDNLCLSSLLHQFVISFEVLWLQRRFKSTTLFLEQVKLILQWIQTLHQVLTLPMLDLWQGEEQKLLQSFMLKQHPCPSLHLFSTLLKLRSRK